MDILIVSFRNNILSWENNLATRLSSAGYNVHIEYSQTAPAAPVLKSVLAFEGWRNRAAAASPAFASAGPPPGKPDAVIDLTGRAKPGTAPVLTVEIAGSANLAEGVWGLRSGSGMVDLVARWNGKAVGHAAPMIHDRVWLSRDIDQLLVSVQSLVVQTLARFRAGVLEEMPVPAAEPARGLPAMAYITRLAAGLAARALEKVRSGGRDFYWRTAYRFIDGPGIAESGRIAGPDFTTLEDDGQRFYADPFLFEHDGRSYLFIEEFPYATGRGVISVAELGPDGRFGRPRVVLQEEFHLSYPNVFARDGSIFMIPEGSAAGEVVLYRAEQFPDRWVRDAVLIEGRIFSDATLLEHQGRLWMFGTERFAGGSASDTMTVYSAEHLRGPWTPHPLNPVVIDRAGARPGGKIVSIGGRHFLPVQNGSETYGGGLGLREIVKLDATDIRLGPVLPIRDAAGKGDANIHTLNRAGRLEVIDSFR